MGFFARLFGRGSTSTSADGANILWLYVRCARCGEKIRVRINRNTDAQQEYDESGHPTHHLLRKEILGNRCPALMSVEMQLDRGGHIVEQRAERCMIINEQEYAAG